MSPDGAIHHVINRGNKRATIFHKPEDYNAFYNLLGDAIERVPMRILAVCVMANHFHLVLWPLKGVDLSAYMQWLMNVHVRRYHRHYGSTGLGHVYQGRYKNFIVQSDDHLYRVLQYVEGNAMRASLVRSAEDWSWSSLRRRFTPDGRMYLSEWPVPRPGNWKEWVNRGCSIEELQELRNSVRRGAPYGDRDWVKETVKAHGLESTIECLGRKRRLRLEK